MDPVTHLLTGACLARTGFHRRAAYATATMTLAAEMPDLDVVWSAGGPIVGFEHHRGWTHTFLGLPFEAAVLLGLVWGWSRWRAHRSGPRPAEDAKGRTLAPERWGLLYLFALFALLSHLFLDWTNNYGLRPFFPFNPRWYAGSFVFIVEPVMLLLLALGLLAPVLFGLINSEIGARRPLYRGQGWAMAALVGVLVMWEVRWYEHGRAERLAMGADYGSVELLRVEASPYPGNPFHWSTAVEAPEFFQMASVDTLRDLASTSEQEDRFYKPPRTAAVLAADRTLLGRVYLDWSSYPVVSEVPAPADAPRGTAHTVLYRDLRFLYDTPLSHGRESPPLSGTAFLDGGNRTVELRFDGVVQKR